MMGPLWLPNLSPRGAGKKIKWRVMPRGYMFVEKSDVRGELMRDLGSGLRNEDNDIYDRAHFVILCTHFRIPIFI